MLNLFDESRENMRTLKAALVGAVLCVVVVSGVLLYRGCSREPPKVEGIQRGATQSEEVNYQSNKAADNYDFMR